MRWGMRWGGRESGAAAGGTRTVVAHGALAPASNCRREKAQGRGGKAGGDPHL
jgi:hypothetical protein